MIFHLFSSSSSIRGWAVFLTGTAICLFVFNAFQDLIFHTDAILYNQMALDFLQNGEIPGNFIRLPLFPVVAALWMLFDINLAYFVWFQVIFLVISSYLVFHEFHENRHWSHIQAFLVSSVFYWPQVLPVSRLFLTEALTVLEITLFFFFLFALERKNSLRSAIGLFLASSAGLFTKPAFAVFPVSLIVRAVASRLFSTRNRPLSTTHEASSRVLSVMLLSLVFSMVLVGIHRYIWIGKFVYSPTIGFNLSNKYADFIELVEPEYPELVKPILEARKKMDEAGQGRAVVWTIISDLRKSTGLSMSELNTRFLKIGLLLITRAPGRFLKKIGDSFIRYCKLLPSYVTISESLIYSLFYGLHLILFCFFWIFLAFKLAPPWNFYPTETAILMCILGYFILHLLIEYGDEYRWLMPILPFFYIFSIDFARQGWNKVGFRRV
ncbi:MAG: hypothetical protein HQM09_02040 [Candidatus Riflebacteria bacterium]|nr:hypothetical protein [Candidatus Riflebacteria bacterium]